MSFPKEQKDRHESLGRLPESLLDKLGRESVCVESSASFDVDEHGRYVEGHLVLSCGRLGRFLADGGNWDGRWFSLADVTHAEIVEGLGVHLLRLTAREKSVGEFRFTMRHTREVGRLHRQIQRLVDDKPAEEGEKEPPRDKEDKKVRCDKCGRAIPAWSEFCPACMSRRKILFRLLDFLKPYRLVAGFALFLAIVGTCTGLIQPFLSKPMVNKGLGLAKGAEPNYDLLLFYVLLLAGLQILTAFGDAIRQKITATLGSRLARDVREKTYAHLHKLSLSFFSKKPTGSLVTRITSDSDRIWDFIAFTCIELIVSLLTIVGVGVTMFVMSWRLACVVLVPIPVMLGLMVLFHRKMHKYFHRIFHRWSQLTSVVAGALPGVRVIKAFSQEKREVERFVDRNESLYQGEMQMITLWTLFGPVLQLCSRVGGIVVWVLGGYWVVQTFLVPNYSHPLDPGTLIAFNAAMWMFYGPIHQLSHMDRNFNRAATSVQRIFEILDTEPTIFSHSGASRKERFSGAIELRDVTFSYDGIRNVLKNVSLKIAPGEMIGLAGPSGAGKSTLINLICRFYDVLEGQILIDGVSVRDYDLAWLRRQIGVVLQEPFLFYGTVAENIAYGCPEASLEEIIASSRAANAHDFIVGFPDGYDTMIGERGHTLSGGERQRISIARAVLHNPSILILDEATSSVDTETEKLIQEALDRLVADRTTIAIAHRLSTLRKANRLVILEKGKIVEEGTHEQLIAREGGVYAKLLNMQTTMQSTIAIGG